MNSIFSDQADREQAKVYLVGGGIASLASAFFLIRDGGVPGANITLLDKIPPVTPHDKSMGTQFEALVKAFK